MKIAIVLGVAAALASAPLSASEPEPFGCLKESASPDLADLALEGVLDRAGIREGGKPDFEQTISEALDPCIDSEGISGAALRPYIAGSLGLLVTDRLRERIAITGYDLAEADRIAALSASDPTIMERGELKPDPELFERAIASASRESGMDEKELTILVTAYVAIMEQLIVARADFAEALNE